MKISKNNKSIDITPIRICQQCVFLCKNSPACLLSIVKSYIPCEEHTQMKNCQKYLHYETIFK